MNIREEFDAYCEKKKIPFVLEESIKSPDVTTLFVSAGMQRHKSKFEDKKFGGFTFANVQPCLRVNDLAALGDGTHFAYFNMLGLFSFRDLTVANAVTFWLEFIQDWLGLKIDYATIHPDREYWSNYYVEKNIPVRHDEGNIWSDGTISGYCTEFYIDDIEIGNIVNPFGDCIDAGFGLERLDQLVNGTEPKSKEQLLIDAATAMHKEGIVPGPKEHGYVYRKILRMLYQLGTKAYDVPGFRAEVMRQEIMKNRYEKFKDKFPNKSKEWWFDTHGVEL